MNKIYITLFAILLAVSCNNNVKSKSNTEYVVVPSVSINGTGFNVIDVHSSETTEVDAVKQLNGKLYLPIYSSLPEFDGKVVEGYFVADTNYYLGVFGDIFVVTNHKRDTTTEY